jgi:mRNA interferase MazF
MTSDFISQRITRGEIRWVDFDQTTGREIRDVHPAMIVSTRAINDVPRIFGGAIVVPASSSGLLNPRTGKLIMTHLEVSPSAENGLNNITYFACEQTRFVSSRRIGQIVGTLEQRYVREIENLLCYLMDLFKR